MLKWVGVLLTTLLLGGCQSTTVDEFRYRLVLEVEDNGRVYRGESIRYLRFSRTLTDNGPAVRYETYGEATVVDLGRGRLLVALVTDGIISVNPWLPGLSKDIKFRELLPNQLPPLVSFENNSDPNTVFQVDPDNLENAFGPNIKWRQMYAERANNEPLTRNIFKFLPWLETLDTSLSGEKLARIRGTLADQTGRGHFLHNR